VRAAQAVPLQQQQHQQEELVTALVAAAKQYDLKSEGVEQHSALKPRCSYLLLVHIMFATQRPTKHQIGTALLVAAQGN
jgi:hypothetical protein